MPYYGAGDYYQGDNYAAGSLFSSVGKLLGGVARKVIGATPVGAVASALIPSFNRPMITPMVAGGGGGGMIVPTPGVRGFLQRRLPGGATGYEYQRRRRLNPLNVKALRRAGRRLKGFLRIASRLGALPVNRGKGKRLFKRKARS